MATKREYLVGLGLAKANTRGRFSKAGVEALAKAEAEGVVFDEAKPAGDASVRVEPSTDGATVPSQTDGAAVESTETATV